MNYAHQKMIKFLLVTVYFYLKKRRKKIIIIKKKKKIKQNKFKQKKLFYELGHN